MFDPLMRAGTIVIVKIPGKDVVEVPLIKDDEPVKAFFADRADPTLGKRVGFRGTYRCFDDVDPFGFEDGVEAVRILAITIADQVACRIT